MSKRIAITAPDVNTAGYSGMGMRALGIADVLGGIHEVTVLVDGLPEVAPTGRFRLVADPQERRNLVADADIVITSNALRVRQLAGLRAAVVSDLYDPSYFEWLSLGDTERGARTDWTRHQLQALRRAVATSDSILCANSRQRDLYLGALLQQRSLNGLTQATPADIERQVLIVPNGVSTGEELPDRAEARARLGIEGDDVVFLWGGGVWDWLDVETVVAATLAAHDQDARVRLLFLGVQRGSAPDPHARRGLHLLEQHLGRPGSPIRANDQWVSPSERLHYLAAADAGILGQYDQLETHFSFRTRVVDCLQAGLPVISMSGDHLSEEARRDGWGMTSAPGDVHAMSANLVTLAQDPARRVAMHERALARRAESTWAHTCAPLVDAVAAFGSPSRLERVRRGVALAPTAWAAARSTLARRTTSRRS